MARSVPRPVAGPSKRPQTSKPIPEEAADFDSAIDIDDISVEDTRGEEEEEEDLDEEIVEVAPIAKPKPKAKAKARAPVSAAANGSVKPAPKSKGRAKSPAPRKSIAPRKAAPEEVEVVDEEVEDAVPPAARAANGTRTHAAAPPRKAKEESALRRQLDDVLAQLEKSRAREHSLAEMNEKLLRDRKAPLDAVYQEKITLYEERIQTLAALNDELSANQERVLKMSHTPGVLHFQTREAAQLERKGVEQENARMKKELKERDAKIVELESEARTLNKELKAEIEHSKALAASNNRKAQSAVAVRNVGNPIIQEGQSDIAKLYEDLTNVLVLSLRYESSPFLDLQEKIFHLVYTAADGNALNFYLRYLWEPADNALDSITSEDQLIAHCKYTPMNLDQESDEFKQQLDVLATSFTFVRDQMTMFYRTLLDRLSPQDPPEGEDVDADEDEDEDMKVEYDER